jgi:hypothetical protein
MKKVLIATPCLDQKVDAYYVHSLCESIKLGLKHNFDIKAMFLANESILPMARNELLNLSYREKYDITVFIDDDEYWNADALIAILKSDKDVVCVPVVNKGDKNIAYNVYFGKNIENDPMDEFLVADRVGTGFLKLSKKVVTDLWESNVELTFRNKKLKNICEYTYVNGDFVGEDITLSAKIKELGYKIWVYPHHTVSHIGNKMYVGDFAKSVRK